MFTTVSPNVSSVSPTTTPTVSPADQLTAMMITFSSLVVFVLIVLLGSLIYRKDPFCCKSQAYRDSHADLESSSQHYSSRQTLVGPPFIDSTQNIESLDHIDPQSEQLFYVGMPSTYCLPPMDTSMPHLPSYESVRKKDRQRQIHLMIADRFGLNGPMEAE
ncbi:homeobox protein 4-like, partial [Clarias magur]